MLRQASPSVASLRRAQRSLKAPQSHVRSVSGSTIVLDNLPRSAIPADIRRMCNSLHAENVGHIALDYNRCIPKGRAFLTVTDPRLLQPCLKTIRTSVIGGNLVNARAADDNYVNPASQRSRGAKGREEASERGVLNGSGPDAGIPSITKHVVIWGLPGKLTPESLRVFLRNFKLADPENGKKEVLKLDLPHLKYALTSKFIIRTASVAEAHRIVRKLHMTYFREDIYGPKYPIRASTLY